MPDKQQIDEVKPKHQREYTDEKAKLLKDVLKRRNRSLSLDALKYIEYLERKYEDVCKYGTGND